MKRFEIESNGIWEWRKKQLTWRELCEVLNELYEENIQLKEEIGNWKSSACSYSNSYSILTNEVSRLRETRDIDVFLENYEKYIQMK